MWTIGTKLFFEKWSACHVRRIIPYPLLNISLFQFIVSVYPIIVHRKWKDTNLHKTIFACTNATETLCALCYILLHIFRPCDKRARARREIRCVRAICTRSGEFWVFRAALGTKDPTLFRPCNAPLGRGDIACHFPERPQILITCIILSGWILQNTPARRNISWHVLVWATNIKGH